MERRKFLQGTASAGATGLAVSAGLLTPAMVFAGSHGGEKKEEAPAEAPKEDAAAATEGGYPFESKDLAEVMKALGAEGAEESADIKLSAPEVAENGAVVPIKVDAKAIDGVTSIALITAENQTPLSAVNDLGEGALAFVGCRIKMGKSGDVIAVVKAGDKAYTAKKGVKVTIGGCGG
jgi:sulfur-oxidizing protein SoxY